MGYKDEKLCHFKIEFHRLEDMKRKQDKKNYIKTLLSYSSGLGRCDDKVLNINHFVLLYLFVEET
jgi:hypothetical protein